MTRPTHHAFPFDPTHGLGLDELLALAPPPAPAGFQEFWTSRYRGASKLDPQPLLTASRSSHPDWDVSDVVYTSTGGVRIGGWLLVPRGGKVTRGLVVGHGYGGRDQPDFDIPVEHTALLFPCFRGLSRSGQPSISSDPQRHVLYGIDQPDRYILGGCVEDLWVAVSTLTTLYPEVDGRIGYSGISFGGGIGAIGIPFDKRIDRGFLEVPTFGNMPLWLTLPTTGSACGAQRYARTHPEVLRTLAFFDAATAATLIEVPMLVAVARFDPAVAPPCQFSIANALATSNHHETVILDGGHVDYPGFEEQHMLLAEQIRRLFRVT